MSPVSSPAGGRATIDRVELVRELDARRITLVDVLSPESYAATHIPGAVNLPVADLRRNAARVLPDRHAPIVVYCGSPT